MCQSRVNFNQRANDYLCKVVSAPLKTDESVEANSTEDALSSIDKLNQKIASGQLEPANLMIGSLDVKALYTSIDQKVAGIKVKERILSSKAKYLGVDYKWALKYLALSMTPSEKVDANYHDSRMLSMIPRRTSTHGNAKPSMKTVRVDAKQERFWFPKPVKFLTEDDQKLIVACIGQQLTKLVFTTHYYIWDGKIFKQMDGCPMGVEASCPISRIVMDAWAQEVLKLEEKSQTLSALNPIQFEPLKIYLFRKYVDDVITAVESMKLGVKWDHQYQCFKWSKEQEDLDKAQGRSQEKMTMEQFTAMASGILKCLEFTFDSPSNNTNGCMPVLDTMMWIGRQAREYGIPRQIVPSDLEIPTETGQLKQVILYKFYRK